MDNLLCLFDVWKGRSYVNANVSVSSISNNGQFYLKHLFHRHRNLSSKKFSWHKCQLTLLYSQFSFTRILKTLTVLYIYSILKEYPRASVQMFLTEVDKCIECLKVHYFVCEITQNLKTYRSSRSQMFFIGLWLAILLKKRFQHKCFLVNFATFLRTAFSQNY